MGHTVYPMRWIIYDKISGFKRLIKGLREPERSIAMELIDSVYQNISAITYANPLPNEIESNMIYSMLLQEKKKGNVGIDNLSLYILSLLILNKKCPDESSIHRLLFERE